MNPFLESEEPPGFGAGPSSRSGAPAAAPPPPADEPPAISIDEIAKKLLRENFYLTALELHLELAELGAELPRLRSFFSNPGNFERQTPFKPELGGQLREWPLGGRRPTYNRQTDSRQGVDRIRRVFYLSVGGWSKAK